MNETQYISDFLAPRDAWDKLSIEEQAAMMRTAISEGILDLGTIRQKYNEFAEGGNTDDDLVDWIIREEGFIANPRDIGDGKMTLGSGLTAQKWHDQYKRNGNKWTSSDNRRAVREEVANRRRWAEKNIPNWDSLPSSSQKALLSYKYNYDFNRTNSPKLFKALSDSNLQEAARQMDATSSNPILKKGLQDRRQREQEWFLKDVVPQQVQSWDYLPAVSTQVYNPYVQQVEATRILPINEPDPNSYIRTIEVSPQEQRRRKFQENVEAYQRFNALMDMIDLRSNPAPSYNPIYSLIGEDSGEYAKGGKIYIKPSHRGRLTELKKRTGKTEAELYRTGGPSVRKMITFARNARKWKHGLGGTLFEEGGKPNIFMRPDGTYFYQASPGSEEVTVTPQTTIFDNPALWTYVDKEGKRYTPKETSIPEQGTITEHVSHNPIVDAVNNYYREGIYRANNGTLALRGKYMLPLAGIAATGIGTAIEAPFATAMSIAEGTVGGLATDMLSYGLSGNRWATNMSNWTGLDKPIAELTNPGLLIGGQAGYSGGRTIARGVAQDRILASEHTPKMAELYSKIYKGDISELQNQTPWRALTKGSPNLGNEYGIFDKNNPLWNPRRDKTTFISELANYTLPFAGPIKTATRWPLANYMSESASPERMLDDVFSLRDVGTMLKPFIKRGKYNGLVDSELGFPTDVEKEYPGINFLNYYLWKNDPLLKLTPSVKTTASYFRENPAPFKTLFGERYNLYGDVSQGRMPVKSAETLDKEIAKELASKHPMPQIRTKDLDGITKEGIENSDKLYRLTHNEAPLEVNKWIGIEEPFNPDLPELNIAGHQMFLDSNNGTLLSRDIWKFNPWDWRVKWGEHGGSAAQAGILDKLGTPFITTSENNLNKDALLYLKSR